MLRIQDAKYMKVGLKDKISQYVDFTYGYGSEATLGFKKQRDTSFPITLIPRGIDEFVTQKHKIVFILQKSRKAEKYNQLLVEIKKGLFGEVYNELPKEIKMLIQGEQY